MHNAYISLLVLIFNSSLLLVTLEKQMSLDTHAQERLSTLLWVSKQTSTQQSSNLLLCLQTECHHDPDE